MKLDYSGKHLKTYRIVERANQLLISPFFKAEVNNLLATYCKKELSEEFLAILETEERVLVKTTFSPFSKKKIFFKSNSLYVNTLRLKSSHRDALASLMHSVLNVADENHSISKLLDFENQRQKNHFFNEFGAISKSYI
ncbi:MAG: hypothetical protein CMP13_15770 [Zunongwangia sp.]|nr:hypothetical protein [Zunongwangia sp.]|tara:strand:+ start:20 stop:436 length:417 start_codon:yes stop_codon:yes gene_type:complete